MQDQMGVSSIQFTVDIYGHLVPDVNRAPVDNLDAEVVDSKDSEAAVN